MNQKNSTVYITGITLVATLGGLLFGYDTAVISGTVNSLEHFFIIPRGLGETAANSLLGTTVSSALIGCIIGSLFAGLISDVWGRKKALIISAVLFLASAIGSAYPELGYGAPGSQGHEILGMFIFYRIIGGIGVGIASMNAPLYISEIAPANIRGRLVSFNQLAIVLGMLIVYFVNLEISRGGSHEWLLNIGWRWMFASEIIPALMFLVFLFFVPETPRWLMMKGQQENALSVLVKMLPMERSKVVLEEIRESLSSKKNTKLLAFGVAVLVVGALLSAFQQFVGINVVLYYAPVIFEEMGAGQDMALVQTIIVGGVNLLFTVVAILTVDRYGRKPLMMIGAVLMGLCMLILGTTFYTDSMGMGSLLCMLGYIAGFALSWGPVTWVLLSEMFPNTIRSWAMSLAVMVQWISNYIVSWTFPMMDHDSYLVSHFHHGFAYWIYGAMAILAAFFVGKYVPETKGKTLEEMEAVWKPNAAKQDQAV